MKNNITLSRIKRRHVSCFMGTVAFFAALSQFTSPLLPEKIERSLRSVEGDVVRESTIYEGIETQRQLPTSADCITIPTIHCTEPAIVTWALNSILQDVGGETELPEVRKIGPGANYVVWDKAPGNGEIPEEFIDKPRVSAWNNTVTITDENIGFVRRMRWEMSEDGKVLIGDYVGFHHWMHNNYASLLMDHLPLLAWLDQEVVSPETKFILLDSPMTKQILAEVNPEFSEQRVVWIKPGELFHVTGDLLVALPEQFPVRGLMQYLLSWLRRLHPEPVEKTNIIYYSRHPDEIRNGRVMDTANEQEVIDVIRNKMTQQLGRSGDELIIFNGLDENHEPMSMDKQFEIFSKAQTIIGPQGGGLANLLWGAAYPLQNCGERTQVLEFFGTTSLYTGFHGLPIDHHMLPFSQRSTLSTTFINIRDLRDGLDIMWHEKSLERQPTEA